MGKHRAQPAYERVIQDNKGKATALMVIPPLLLTAAPASYDGIKPSSSVQVLDKVDYSLPIDNSPSTLYGDSSRVAPPIQTFATSDAALVHRARHAQTVKESVDAEKVRVEQERIAQEEAARVAEEQRLANEKAEADRKKKEELQAAEEAAAKEKLSKAEVVQAEKVPDVEESSDFDITDETQSSDVFAVAEKYLGIPYRFGGNNPATGLDCSSFTQLVYKQLGVSLPRVSRDQAKVGVRVSAEDARPGDLVFFGSPVHHVGIYAGNGRILDARKTGTVIGYGNVWNENTQYRRVL